MTVWAPPERVCAAEGAPADWRQSTQRREVSMKRRVCMSSHICRAGLRVGRLSRRAEAALSVLAKRNIARAPLARKPMAG